MVELLVIVLVGLGTFGMRAAFLVRTHRAGAAGQSALLPLVAPAVLAAIAAPALLAPRGTGGWTESIPSLLAALVTLLVWRRAGGFPIPLLAGLVTWWAALALVSLL
ncbi:AzlD domain-containing protein [Intrasporangium sp.]|uniref:AzlD domain-containing protein n=1 Tax=Intrasporangium sp. TaxID=1925024 RepID=UPI00293AF724|nr:AzlD domain-containing protein [Intrasporangium sp.]MDV3222213.1 AzlD domain-containing protein [Intrasporangium sp.]